MTHDAMTEHYEEITVCGKPALFTSIRIKRDTVPEGLYAYNHSLSIIITAALIAGTETLTYSFCG